MNYRMILKFFGLVLLIEAGLVLVPIPAALVYGESALPFIFTALIIFVCALPMRLIKPKNKRIYAKEGFVCVAASWILLSAFGALPFIFSGAIPNYIDAFFETVSGFTTTGASIIPSGGIESLPKGILFWRSFTHWIGGMGILVFMLAILPDSEGNVIHLMRAEVPGPQKGKLVPKLKESSLILYSIYLVLTVAEIIALLCTGMPFYDCLINSFGTLGTGGFSVLDASIAGYMNPAAEWIMAIFLLLAGINYNIYFFIITKKFREIKKNEELRVYLVMVLIFTGAMALDIYTSPLLANTSVSKSIRDAFFQVTSIISTAGFTTIDLGALPNFSQALLLILMLTGACAGSTAGGFKLSRFLIIFKSMKREIRKFFKPNSVSTVRLDGNTLEESTVKSSVTYMSLFIIVLVFSFVLVATDEKDILTTFTAVLACVNNIGPGLGEAVSSMADFSYFSKIVLSVDMLLGRLEIIPLLILFSPSTWAKN